MLKQLNTNIKLLILPIIVIVSMLILSFIFSQKIQLLKKEVNLIYFGNFTPVHKLHTLKEYYIQIINTNKISTTLEKKILKEWGYYVKQYKSNEEQKLITQINTQLLSSLKSHKKSQFKKTLTNLTFLIKYEVDSAYLQRKSFLLKYHKMQDYIFYAQIFIMLLVLGLMGLIIYNTINKNNALALLNEQYKIEANTDALTNLYNRKYFDTIFSDLTTVSYQHDWNSVFVMIDIDFFKQFNDTYGHDAGDIALKKVSSTLDTSFNKKYEYTFRLGGEEFGIIIFNASINYIKSSLDNLQNKIAKQQIVHQASKTGFLTLSMGVTIIDSKSYDLSTQELYNNADKKLYHSKETGRDKYTI